MKPENKTGLIYTPFDKSQYRLSDTLTEEERAHISNSRQRTKYQNIRDPVPDLVKPLKDIARWSGASSAVEKTLIQVILAETFAQDLPCWKWPKEAWLSLFDKPQIRAPLLAAFACHLGSLDKPPGLYENRQPALYAQAIFGKAFFHQELNRLLEVLVSLGYSRRSQEMFLSAVLGMLMLENGDPRLESFSENLLKRGQQQRSEGIARAVGKVSHGLAALGILSRPIRMRGYLGWREKSTEGIAPEWVHWCKKWRETSVLQPRTRESIYSFILRTGLWLTREHPEIKQPSDWNIGTCAGFIAALGRLNVDELSLTSAQRGRGAARSGLPFMSSTRNAFLYSLRRFFLDYEFWDWGKLKFSPLRHLARPRAPSFSNDVNPRVIDDPVWLKLTWASLNLRREDMLTEIHYPLSMMRAMAVIWTHAGLRSNEIIRLVTSCIREQSEEIIQDDNSVIPPGTLCYLEVPTGKTSTSFVKPVAAIIKKYIDEWLQERPKEQAALTDERTGEKVNFLFQYRGKPVSRTFINETIIPMLCIRANMPLHDSKGKITSHRGRASALTALASVSQGMSIFELMQWAGHSSPKSAMHYIRIRPTKLAASFIKADKISHMVSVLVDMDIISLGESGPKLYYDLGNSYCMNPFWSNCPHRMVCVGCDFNLPKSSSHAQALESKSSVKRFMEEIPLTQDEKTIIEGDIEKINAFIKKIEKIPALDGKKYPITISPKK